MLTQAKLERENAPLAVPLASTRAASGAPEGSAEALLLARADPTAAELQWEAQVLSRWCLANRRLDSRHSKRC